MKKSNIVTPGQANEVRQMANAKGVTRGQLQRALSDGSLSRFLDSLKYAITAVDVFKVGENPITGHTLLRRLHKISGWKRGDKEAFDFYLEADNWKYLPSPKDCDVIIFGNTVFDYAGEPQVRWFYYDNDDMSWQENYGTVDDHFYSSCYVAVGTAPL